MFVSFAAFIKPVSGMWGPRHKSVKLPCVKNQQRRSNKYFTEKGDEYKLDLLKRPFRWNYYFLPRKATFTDLCRGPHIPDTGFYKSSKADEHCRRPIWRGDESKKQLTRIYGITFPKTKRTYRVPGNARRSQEARSSKIGKELELFTFSDFVGPGLPLWMPNGTVMIEELEKLAKRTEMQAGYQRVTHSSYCKREHVSHHRAFALLC